MNCTKLRTVFNFNVLAIEFVSCKPRFNFFIDLFNFINSEQVRQEPVQRIILIDELHN